MKQKLKGALILLTGTVIWGSAFVAQSVGMDYIGPFTFQAVRCALAVVLLIPLSFFFEEAPFRPDAFLEKWLNPRLWKAGAVCGLALFVAGGLQQVGLVYTTPGKAGFITAMYIVLVPILGLFLGREPPAVVWVSVALAAFGLYLLSGAGSSGINYGDLCVLGSAFAFAVQITLVDRHAANLDGIRLNCIQSLVCSVLSAVLMFATETPSAGAILSCWLPLCYAGFLSMGVAYSFQIIGQKYIEPAAASLIMSLESVFSVLFAWILLKQTMTPGELLGCGLVFGAVLLTQLPSKRNRHD